MSQQNEMLNHKWPDEREVDGVRYVPLREVGRVLLERIAKEENIRQRTLLDAARMVCWMCGSDHAEKYPFDPSGSYHVSEELTNGVQPCEGAKLRALAERIATLPQGQETE